jgi:hypothetical protein
MRAENSTVAAQVKSPPRPKVVTGQGPKDDPRLNIAGEDRRRLIAEAAYFRAEQRGFVPGQEFEDWLAAEIEIDALLGEDDGRT